MAAAMLLVGVIEIACAYSVPSSGPRWLVLCYVAVAWVYVGAGLLTWSRRPGGRFGFLITVGGLTVLAGQLFVTGVPALIAISEVVASVPLGVLVHLLHAFPSGRLSSRPSRLTVVSGYAVCLVLQVPLYLFTTAPSPYDVLEVANRPDLANLGRQVQTCAGGAVMFATVVILASRLRRATPRQRTVLGPLFVYGILAVVFVPLSGATIAPWLGFSPDSARVAQLIDVAGIPVVVTAILLRGGFARTGEINELSTWLSTAEAGRSPLSSALASALGDESARLIFWVPERREYVDATGEQSALPTDRRRGLAEIALSGERIGAIDYDMALNADAERVRAAGRVIAIAVGNERVTAELRASQQALRRSRARIVEAGDAERRRLARDLHDGLQVRLVLLALQAQQIATSLAASPGDHDAAVELRVGIDSAAAELRNLVHAVVPAALIERGLCAATEDLVDHLPVPTHLEISVAEHSLPAVVESTAYFVIAEALTNALKHAQPSSLTVLLSQVRDVLHIEVADDGVGGAHRNEGSGLRGLADRVDTLGGRLYLHSPAGHGTRIVAELPCES